MPPPLPPIDRPAWGWIALTVITCAFFGVAPQAHSFEVIGVPDAVRAALRWQGGVAVAWALAAVPLARRWSLADREGRALLALIGLALVVSVASGWLGYVLLRPTGNYPRGVMVVEMMTGALPTHALTATMLSLVGSWTNARRLRARAADREALLEAHATRAELDALRERMHPHFVLNALNTVAALARRGDGEQAGDAAADLGEILQFSLTSTGDLVAFDTERAIVERYLAIEQARYGVRLAVSWELAPDVHTTHLPALAWQPLVENAVRHGIARRTAPGTIRLAAWRDATSIHLVVDADGPNESTSSDDPASRDALGGLGLGEATLERRLALLYGDAASIVREERAGGTRVTLTIPLALPPRPASTAP